MSSILTNNSAMVALQSLQSVNSNLAKTQDMISTGKAVGSAKDNAAVFAISKVMESDVSGFKAISDSLSLGESTVAVGRQAAETTTDLLKEIKGKIVGAQEENVDRAKIQTDIGQLRDQIASVVGAAQFNGLNFVDGSSTETVDVLASLDRDSAGTVTAGQISVSRQDLSQTVMGAGATDTTGVGSGNAIAAGASGTVVTFARSPAAGETYQVNSGALAGADTGNALSADVVYVASEGDTLADVNKEMATRLNVQAAKDGIDVTFSVDGDDIVMQNNSGEEITADQTEFVEGDGSLDGTVGGQLDLLAGIDVSTGDGAAAGLVAIESLIQKSIDSAASFGSAEQRIGIQSDFVGKLTDALTSGIGSLVDANMEEASARLQALQVQQQLATQSLSIANQAPQALLSLFRG
jgi:flagellin